MDALLLLTEKLSGFWSFKVAIIDSNPITVANIVIALIVFIFGLRLARKLSVLFEKRVFSRLELNDNARAAMQTIFFYILIAIFTFVSLDIAQIPLRVFAFLGGALAIGIGFGSQNLVKDFISGLIIMIEQPVRLGDMIELGDGTNGRIVKIGAISTHIRTFRNIDVLVPNHSLIEGQVINWTLSDRRAKRSLNVGVAYGSPTRKVEELLCQAANENERVITEKPPQAYFINFGDNTLDFELHYWIQMSRPGDERRVASELRHRLVELFDDHHVAIAFPQRDVHLDSARPLEISLVKEAG